VRPQYCNLASVRGGRGAREREGERVGVRPHGLARVRANAVKSSRTHWRPHEHMARPRGHAHVRVDASVLPPGNFIMDATVRPSHGRPSGHRPSVRPSVRYRPRDNPSQDMQAAAGEGPSVTARESAAD
jgi:hypothetical protein